MNSRCIIYYHGNDWDGVPARQRYLMAAMACTIPVVFLDGNASRPWRITARYPQKGVTVVSGLVEMLRRLERRGLHRIARWMTTMALRRHVKGFEQVICWLAEPAIRPDRFLRHDLLVYDSIDPTFDEDPSAIAYYRKVEDAVVKCADHVFATAAALLEDCKRVRPDVHLLPNACEPDEYTPELLSHASRPAWFPDGPGPVAAYLGTLDWRVDYAALEAACTSMPDIQFVIAGYILPQFRSWVDRISSLSNVVCPGRITVEEGRFLLAQCTIGLIPFRRCEMNDRINPVKMYSYALMGKPIAGTHIRELVERADIVSVSASSDACDFPATIRHALNSSKEPARADLLRRFAVANTWKHRAADALSVLRASAPD